MSIVYFSDFDQKAICSLVSIYKSFSECLQIKANRSSKNKADIIPDINFLFISDDLAFETSAEYCKLDIRNI